MKREDIEKAAQTSLEEMCISTDSWDEDMYKDGFIDGAQWRINSVLHGKELIPEEHKEILVRIVGDSGEVETWVEEYNKEYHALENSGIDWEEVITWAYINDLFPEGKE